MEFDRTLIDKLRIARHVTVLTGAGVSAESGLPTFRDAMRGLWASYRAEDLATAEAFETNPKLVWDWYAWRRDQARAAQPNAGHFALVKMQSRVPRFSLITQNVDGLHQRAGSHDVVELHGSIHRVKCFDEGDVYESWEDNGDDVPRCPRCRRGYLRPDVVWFGEQLAEDALAEASSAARRCDVFLSIGTSGVVQPAASLIRFAAGGALTCVVNKEPVSSDYVHIILAGASGEILPALVRAAWPD